MTAFKKLLTGHVEIYLLESIEKEATRKKNLLTFLYYEARIKARGFSFKNQNERNLK